MNERLLSILIPNTKDREESVKPLLSKLFKITDIDNFDGLDGDFSIKQGHNKDIQIIVVTDDKKMTIGEKRERMYGMGDGLYSWQLDSDDDISDNAIELILEGIRANPDCVTFQEYVNIDGKEFRSNHSLEYDDWHDNFGGYDFVRTPFFKSVIKTSIAQSVPIPHIRFGEDHQWAQALKPHLQTEVHIPEQLYRYIHVSSNSNERYGLDRD